MGWGTNAWFASKVFEKKSYKQGKHNLNQLHLHGDFVYHRFYEIYTVVMSKADQVTELFQEKIYFQEYLGCLSVNIMLDLI